MVVTLTGIDMARKKGGKMNRSTAGYAYIGGACVRNTYLKKISSVALVEDSGGYSGVVLAAHEIGHLLGAVHDGDPSPSYLGGPGAKSCPWSKGFIMSDLRRTSRGQLWSDCSVKQMKHFLKTRAASCLYNLPSNHDYSLPGVNNLPGKKITLDAQCYADRGTRACYHDQRVCAQLFCYNKGYNGCYALRPAVEGSDCGRGRICRNGKCVSQTSPKLRKQEKDDLAEVQQVRTTERIVSNPESTTAAIIEVPSTSKQKTINKNIKNKKTVTKSTNIYTTTTTIIITTSASTTVTTTQQNNYAPKMHMKDVKNPSNEDDVCEDSFTVLGSLTCAELFQRYAFHYCKHNRVIKIKCCKTFHKACNSPR